MASLVSTLRDTRARSGRNIGTMPIVGPALRFVLSRRGLVTLAAIQRVRKAGREWFPVKVTGISMIPTLRPGDLLAVRFPRAGEPRAGQIVIATTDERELVKRVIATPGERMAGRALADDEFLLGGDNTRAVGSPIRAARGDIVGIVRSRYWPAGRARLFP
jgi:hypothetical protein